MKKALLGWALIMTGCFGQAATYQWQNTMGDNSFGNFANWNGPNAAPTTFDTNNFYINLIDGDRAVIASSLAVSNCAQLRIGGASSTSPGELWIVGGTNIFGNQLQVGSTRTGILMMAGGRVEFPQSYATVGQGVPAHGILTMTGGVFRSDRMTVATVVGSTGAVTISGGIVTISATASNGASTSGSLRMGSGVAEINIGGTAEVNVEALTLGDNASSGPGIFTMSGGVLNITGSTLTNPVATLAIFPGRSVAFEGGVWNIAGNLKTNLQQAITDGYISGPGGSNDWIRVVYDSGADKTAVSLVQPTSLESWRFQYFGTIEDVGNAANIADPENDGVENLLEFAFGLNPLRSDSALLPSCILAGGNLTMAFSAPGGVGGIVYGAECSTNLIHWSLLTDGGIGANHTFSVPIGTDPKKFMRLLVTEP